MSDSEAQGGSGAQFALRLAAIVLCAAIVYVALAGSHWSIDGTDYIAGQHSVAMGLLRGEGLCALSQDLARGPLYPMLLAGGLLLWDYDPIRAYQTVTILCSLGMLVAIGVLIRHRWGERVALWTVVLLAVNPHSLHSAVFNNIDIVIWFTASAALVCAWVWGGAWGWLLAGLFAGLAVITKMSGIWVLVWAVGAVWLATRPAGLWQRSLWLLLFSLGAAVTIAPWFAVLTEFQDGNPLRGSHGISLHPSLFPPGKTVEGGSVFDLFAAWPLGFTRAYATRYLWGLAESSRLLLILTSLAVAAWIGLIAFAIRPRRWDLGLIAFFALFWALHCMLGVRARYHFMLIPLLILGLVCLVGRLTWQESAKPKSKWMGHIICGILAAVWIIGGVADQISSHRALSERMAPSRALIDWFESQAIGEAQAIWTHPHDPARVALTVLNGPVPVDQWYPMPGQSWRDDSALFTWVLYNPRFDTLASLWSPNSPPSDSHGNGIQDLLRSLEGDNPWVEFTVPGLAPCRLFACGSDALERGLGLPTVIQAPHLDQSIRAVSLGIQNTGAEAGRAVIALRQRAHSVTHRQEMTLRNYYDPDRASTHLFTDVPAGCVNILLAETPLLGIGETMSFTLPIPPSYPDRPIELIVSPWAERGAGGDSFVIGEVEGEATLLSFNRPPTPVILSGEELMGIQPALESLRSNDPAIRSEGWLALARMWQADGESLASLHAARNLVDAAPESVEAHTLRGLAAHDMWNRTRDTEFRNEAEEAFLESWHIQPAHLWTALRVARLRSDVERWDETVDLLEPLRSHSDVTTDLHFRLAEAYDHIGAVDQAVECYERFLAEGSEAELTGPRGRQARERLAHLRGETPTRFESDAPEVE